MMPVMDGITLVSKLKKNEHLKHIPIILLTAKTAAANQMDALEKGAFEYITKPVNIGVLKAKIFAVLRNVEQLKSHYKNIGILPTEVGQNAHDEDFMLKATQVVESNFETSSFSSEDFAAQMGISRSGLYKKLQSIVGKSTTEFIRFVRLKHAERLLKEGRYNISQTAYKVGFNDVKYFRKCFKKEFGQTPSAFLKEGKVNV